ncbi:MAG: ferredoxin [Ferruginibacter sp.]|nr:ferredoxin [Ferruginibacter sp.]
MGKIIHYRKKCIGCGICFELQPELWRMSKKDGKANLLKSIAKKDLFVLSVSNAIQQLTQEVTRACPVKIIKVL